MDEIRINLGMEGVAATNGKNWVWLATVHPTSPHVEMKQVKV
jgi:hypothetical protein